jgi:hypothetical protein
MPPNVMTAFLALLIASIAYSVAVVVTTSKSPRVPLAFLTISAWMVFVSIAISRI